MERLVGAIPEALPQAESHKPPNETAVFFWTNRVALVDFLVNGDILTTEHGGLFDLLRHGSRNDKGKKDEKLVDKLHGGDAELTALVEL